MSNTEMTLNDLRYAIASVAVRLQATDIEGYLESLSNERVQFILRDGFIIDAVTQTDFNEENLSSAVDFLRSLYGIYVRSGQVRNA